MRLQLDSSTVTSADNARIASTASAGARTGSRTVDRVGTNTDSIGISGTSAALSRLSGERTERIQQLATAVRAGSYNIPSAAIASTLLAQASAASA
jgi:anti-sigma28 factor (negative regulator of flagellin synthesis)